LNKTSVFEALKRGEKGKKAIQLKTRSGEKDRGGKPPQSAGERKKTEAPVSGGERTGKKKRISASFKLVVCGEYKELGEGEWTWEVEKISRVQKRVKRSKGRKVGNHGGHTAGGTTREQKFPTPWGG